MGVYAVFGVALVDCGLEDHHGEVGVLGSTNPSDELFGLAAEHTADNDLHPTGAMWDEMLMHVFGLTQGTKGFHGPGKVPVVGCPVCWRDTVICGTWNPLYPFAFRAYS